MGRRWVWITWICGSMPLGLVLLATRAPVRAVGPASSVPVSITEAGLVPDVITVTAATEVVWTNLTQQTVHLVSGVPFRIYLPAVLRQAAGAAEIAPGPMGVAVTSAQNGWMDAEIAPGESVGHTFQAAGAYPYFLVGPPGGTGRVIVTGQPLFATVYWAENEGGYATAPDTASLDLGVGDGDDFTVETFFYVPDLSYDDAYADLLTKKDDSYELYISFNSPAADWIIFELTTAGGGTVSLGCQIHLGLGWHHVAAVYDNEYSETEDLIAIYLDGTRVASSADEGVHVDWTPGIPNSWKDQEVGGVPGGKAGFHGYLEEMRFSDVVRYSGASYTVPGEPFAVDAYTRALWHFDETEGSTSFADASSYGNHLTGGGGAQTHTP